MRVHRNDAGAAAVETALVLPFVLLLLCGLVDFGRAYSAKVTLSHAAREGVRVWALTQDLERATVAAEGAAVGLDPVTIASTDCNTGESTTLRVAYSFSYITPISGLIELMPGGAALPNPITLDGTGVMRCGG